MAFVADVRVKFSIDGDERELKFPDVPYGTWEELKRTRGFTPATLLAAVSDGDVEAVVSLLWLERRQTNSTAVYRASVRELEKSDGILTIVDISTPEDEPDGDREPDPTISGDNS